MNPLIWLIVLLLPLVPFLNLYRLPGFIRRLQCFPRIFFFLGGVMVLYLTLSVLLVLYFVQYVPVIIALGSPLVFYVYYWRARPAFGSRKRLPPGSLRLAPSGPWVNYRYYQQQADTHGPIFKMNNFVQPMICLTGIDRGTEFLKRHEEATTTPPMPFNSHIPDGFMRYMPPAIHMDYRNRMKRVFSDYSFLGAREESIRGIIRDHLLTMTDCSNPIPPAPHFHKMSFAIFVLLFLGLSPHDRPFRHLQELYGSIDYRDGLFSTNSQIEKTLREIEEIFLNQVKTKESYFRKFLGDEVPDRGELSTDKTLLRNFIYLLQTSYIDVADLIAWSFKLLSDNPTWLHTLRDQIRSQDGTTIQSAHQLANRMVLETVRLEQSEYLMRKALHDIEFEGWLIPKGWLVRIGVRESHRDPEIFKNPDDYNPDRFLETSYGPMQFSPFGIQQKSCLGKGLTLWIVQKFVLELARGFAWRVVQDGHRELGVFHWRPSSKLRVRMSRLSDHGFQ